MPPTSLDPLRAFRRDLFACFPRRADALFEIADSLITADPGASPIHLSLAPPHRRGWGSFYAALRHGALDVERLRNLLVAHLPATDTPVYAIDASTWPRCDAETSPDRAFYYHPSRHSSGQPVVPGWSYQWLTQISFTRESWTAPVDVRRLLPTDNVNTVALEQIRAFGARRPATAPPATFVFDAGYDPVQLGQDLPANVAILVRLRSGRCFYADPPPPKATGRPSRHGDKLVCADPATWPPVTTEHQCEDVQYGTVRVRAWADLHAKTQEYATRGSRAPRPIVRGTLILVEVSRLPGRSHAPQALWLWWQGPGTPDLAVLWRAYVQRFDLEHTFRFLKQTLYWTAVHPRLPQQADRWTWLIVIAYTELRLARTVVADHRLPWERVYPVAQLTPARVRRVFRHVWAVVGTPAQPPKPAGRSAGRPKGRRSLPAPRHPVVKKAA
jgi:hypothetical protein